MHFFLRKYVFVVSTLEWVQPDKVKKAQVISDSQQQKNTVVGIANQLGYINQRPAYLYCR
jgi:hypothetical protein